MNIGVQNISYCYNFELTAQAFNAMWRGLLKHGTYQGLTLTKKPDTNDTATIVPGVVLVDDGNVATKIDFTQGFEVAGITPQTPYVVVRYQYAAVEGLYADVIAVSEANLMDVRERTSIPKLRGDLRALATAQGPGSEAALELASRRVGGDVILGKAKFDIGGVLFGFDDAERDLGNMLLPGFVYVAETNTYEFRKPHSSDPDANLEATMATLQTMALRGQLNLLEGATLRFPDGSEVGLLTTDQRDAVAGAGTAEAPPTGANPLVTAGQLAGAVDVLTQAHDADVQALADHEGQAVTDANTVHGIRQGSGQGFDADKVDGKDWDAELADVQDPNSGGIKQYIDEIGSAGGAALVAHKTSTDHDTRYPLKRGVQGATSATSSVVHAETVSQYVNERTHLFDSVATGNDLTLPDRPFEFTNNSGRSRAFLVFCDIQGVVDSTGTVWFHLDTTKTPSGQFDSISDSHDDYSKQELGTRSFGATLMAVIWLDNGVKATVVPAINTVGDATTSVRIYGTRFLAISIN